MDESAGLILRDLGELHRGDVLEAPFRRPQPPGELAPKGSRRATPEDRGVPLPHDRPHPVVAVRAEGRTDRLVVLLVSLKAGELDAVRADLGRVGATRPATAAVRAHPVDEPERRSGERDEQQRGAADGRGYALAADDARPDQLECVPRVGA